MGRPKEEWLTYSGWNYSAEQLWLRNRIAELFDLEVPNETQRQLLYMANLLFAFGDVPSPDPAKHEADMTALALKEFGPPPWWWRFYLVFSALMCR